MQTETSRATTEENNDIFIYLLLHSQLKIDSKITLKKTFSKLNYLTQREYNYKYTRKSVLFFLT
jgi:hypothetical protein